MLFLFVKDYGVLTLDAMITGLGFAFSSSAIEALIYDALKSQKRDHEMSKVIGQLNGAGYLGSILSFGISGLLVTIAALFVRVDEKGIALKG